HFFERHEPIIYSFFLNYHKEFVIFIDIHIVTYLTLPEPRIATSSSHSAHTDGNTYDLPGVVGSTCLGANTP
ncbi:hypothetical protein VBJ47_24495, partial [Enterobacter hormaechei]|nr:hypothetical protein [Enterobacter hormaechei]